MHASKTWCSRRYVGPQTGSLLQQHHLQWSELKHLLQHRNVLAAHAHYRRLPNELLTGRAGTASQLGSATSTLRVEQLERRLSAQSAFAFDSLEIWKSAYRRATVKR